MNIEQEIYSVYHTYNNARKPKHLSQNPPPEQPYSESEVHGLVIGIVNRVNSEIANYHFNNKENS